MRADERPSAQRGPPENRQRPAGELWASGDEAGRRMRADERPSARRAVRLRTGKDAPAGPCRNADRWGRLNCAGPRSERGWRRAALSTRRRGARVRFRTARWARATCSMSRCARALTASSSCTTIRPRLIAEPGRCRPDGAPQGRVRVRRDRGEGPRDRRVPGAASGWAPRAASAGSRDAVAGRAVVWHSSVTRQWNVCRSNNGGPARTQRANDGQGEGFSRGVAVSEH
jgi:hypothetical protein